MQSIFDFGSREPLTTMIIAAALVGVLAVFAFTRHRRKAHSHRDTALPPLVFAVRDRVVPDMRPAGLHRKPAPTDAASPTQPRPPAPDQHPPAREYPLSEETIIGVQRYEERGRG
jgi:hypothetical protein